MTNLGGGWIGGPVFDPSRPWRESDRLVYEAPDGRQTRVTFVCFHPWSRTSPRLLAQIYEELNVTNETQPGFEATVAKEYAVFLAELEG